MALNDLVEGDNWFNGRQVDDLSLIGDRVAGDWSLAVGTVGVGMDHYLVGN
jgi:hypothetical protein